MSADARRLRRGVIGTYLAFAVFWGAGGVAATVGDGPALVPVLVVVHVAVGFAVGRWWIPFLALAPVAAAVTFGTDLVERPLFLIAVGLGSSALLAVGVVARRRSKNVSQNDGLYA